MRRLERREERVRRHLPPVPRSTLHPTTAMRTAALTLRARIGAEGNLRESADHHNNRFQQPRAASAQAREGGHQLSAGCAGLAVWQNLSLSLRTNLAAGNGPGGPTLESQSRIE